MKKVRDIRIDLLKSFAIISVIILHFIVYSPNMNKETLINILAVFHIWQAVPIFIFLLGYNQSRSTHNKYLRIYFKNKVIRISPPIFAAFLLSLLALLIFNEPIIFNLKTIFGQLPIIGPGNYFISIILQFIVVFPLIYWLYEKYKYKGLFFMIFTEIVFNVFAYYKGLSNPQSQLYFIYNSSILRFLALIYLGVIIGRLKKIKINATHYMYALISITYLIYFNFNYFNKSLFLEIFGINNFFSYGYIILIILFILKKNIRESRIINFFALFGEYSLEIFLFQIIYFGLLINQWTNIKNNFFYTFLIIMTGGSILFIVKKIIKKTMEYILDIKKF